MDDPFAELNALELWDFQIRSFARVEHSDEDVLVVLGSRDFCYYHNAELRFSGVEYIDLPTNFSHARFRAAADDEVSARSFKADFEGNAYAIVVEHGANVERVCFVVARAVAVSLQTVRYYARTSEAQADG